MFISLFDIFWFQSDDSVGCDSSLTYLAHLDLIMEFYIIQGINNNKITFIHIFKYHWYFSYNKTTFFIWRNLIPESYRST